LDELEHLWPDPDRRAESLRKLHRRVIGTELRPDEVRTLQIISHGTGVKGAAELQSLSETTVLDQLWSARKLLGAKNTVHACCIALRQGLIR
jgi:DNA-binding NarL/FixJ family response regulator